MHLDASAPAVSVLIPTFERASQLLVTLDAWREHLASRDDVEVVVIDDGSRDETAVVLNAQQERFAAAGIPLVAHSQENAGAAKARNQAIEASRGSLLLFSDDDMVPRPGFVDRHLAAQREAPGAWVSRLVVPDFVVDTPFQRYWQRRLHSGTQKRTSGSHLGWTGFWFATLSLPRNLLGDQRFSKAFEGYAWEDHELGVRLWRSGVRARFLRAAEAEHQDRVSLPSVERKFEKLGVGAWVFSCLHPTLRVRALTGTLGVSRFVRTILPIGTRAERARGKPESARLDSDWVAILEAAYGRGLAQGAVRAFEDDCSPRRQA